MNNKITVYAPKRFNLIEIYDIRVNLALLIQNKDIINNKTTQLTNISKNNNNYNYKKKETTSKKRKEERRSN